MSKRGSGVGVGKEIVLMWEETESIKGKSKTQNAKVLCGNSCALLPSWNSVHWAATWQTQGWNCCQGSVPHKSILAKHIPVQTLWLCPKVSIIPTDLLGAGIIPEAYDLSSESNPVKVHRQMNVGRHKCTCRSLTPFRHSSSQSEANGQGTQSWLSPLLTSSRSLSLHMTMDAHYYDFIFPETV